MLSSEGLWLQLDRAIYRGASHGGKVQIHVWVGTEGQESPIDRRDEAFLSSSAASSHGGTEGS